MVKRRSIFILAVLILMLVPLLAMQTRTKIGSSEIEVGTLATKLIQGEPFLDLRTETVLGASGADICLVAANGASGLTGPFSPRPGGDVFIEGGAGSAERGAADGGPGGSVWIFGGTGGRDENTGSPTATGNGGDIFLRAGRPGRSFGFPGNTGAQGRIQLLSHDNETQLTVSSGGVAISHLLYLATRTPGTLPTCDSSQRGAVFVHNRLPSNPDALCVCIDNTGNDSFSWFDLTGNSACP